MGAVYRAYQISLDRDVAIKILPKRLAQDPAYVERFHVEAQAAAKIRHPGIVQVYDAGEHEENYYFVMEYIDGETTKSRLQRKGHLTEENLLLVAEYVAMALEHAWDVGKIIHRDVKPDNILIDQDGTVKITDLGLAKFVGSARATITMTPMAMGTPYYCSPEQARGLPDVDFHTDIYALGATMYHLITGQAPFEDSTGVTAMARHISEQIADPCDLNTDLSPNVGWLLEKMTAKDMQKRQPTWGDVLTDIRRAKEELPPVPPFLKEGESTIMRGRRRAHLPKMRTRRPSPSGVGDAVLPEYRGTSNWFKAALGAAGLLTVAILSVQFQMKYSEKRTAAYRRLHDTKKHAAGYIRDRDDIEGYERAIALFQEFAQEPENRYVQRDAEELSEHYREDRRAALERRKKDESVGEQRQKRLAEREKTADSLLEQAKRLAKRRRPDYRRITEICNDVRRKYGETKAAVQAKALSERLLKKYEGQRLAREEARDREQRRMQELRVARGAQWTAGAVTMLQHLRRREYERAQLHVSGMLRAWTAQDNPKADLAAWTARDQAADAFLKQADYARATPLIAETFAGDKKLSGVELSSELRVQIRNAILRIGEMRDVFGLLEREKRRLIGKRYELRPDFQDVLGPAPFRPEPVEDMFDAPNGNNAPPVATVKNVSGGELWLTRRIGEYGGIRHGFRLRDLRTAVLADMIRTVAPTAHARALALLYVADGQYAYAERCIEEARKAETQIDDVAAWLAQCRAIQQGMQRAAEQANEPAGNGQTEQGPAQAVSSQPVEPDSVNGPLTEPVPPLKLSSLPAPPLSAWLKSIPQKLLLFGPRTLVTVDIEGGAVYRINDRQLPVERLMVPVEEPALWVASPDQQFLLMHRYRSQTPMPLSVFSLADGRLIKNVPGVRNCTRVALAPRSRRVALATGDREVRLVDIQEGRQEWTGLLDGTLGLSFSSDGARLLAVGERTTAKIVDVATRTTQDLQVRFVRAAFVPNSPFIAGISREGVVTVLDSISLQETKWHRKLDWEGDGLEMAVDPRGEFLCVLTIGRACLLRVYDLSGNLLHQSSPRTKQKLFPLYRRQGIQIALHEPLLFAQDTLYLIERDKAGQDQETR